MLRPNFEDPIDTAQQLVDNNINLYMIQGSYFWKQYFNQSSIPEYKKLAETMYFPKDLDEFNLNFEQYIMTDGTHALMTSYLTPKYLGMGRWWRSKDTFKSISPYGGYVSNKKWCLNEVGRKK